MYTQRKANRKCFETASDLSSYSFRWPFQNISRWISFVLDLHIHFMYFHQLAFPVHLVAFVLW